MGWRQFFTPVRSMNATEAKAYMDGLDGDGFQLVDVRQPAEYEAGHLPGAQLMPVAELSARSADLDPDKPTLVYCAIGGRSRVAAQMLAGKGFSEVINLSGGIKAWRSNTAVGPEDRGLELFSGSESLAEVLSVAYGLETALLEFYESLAGQIDRADVREVFHRLAAIEVKHQQRIADYYRQVRGGQGEAGDVAGGSVGDTLEGGLTTKQYLELYQPDLQDVGDVLSLAMAIEAQALDLYQRAADRADNSEMKEALSVIAGEERQHLKQLGELFADKTGSREEP
jgi:sulfur-carrier protein adenylyltransferase/sulfurtransferase